MGAAFGDLSRSASLAHKANNSVRMPRDPDQPEFFPDRILLREVKPEPQPAPLLPDDRAARPVWGRNA